MNLEAFVTARRPEWDELRAALERCRGRPERLGEAGALALGRSYRAAAADLALARRRFPGDPLIPFLEALVVAGRGAIYGERQRRGSLLRFYSRGYWRLVVGRPGVLAVSLAVLFGSCLAAAAWAVH